MTIEFHNLDLTPFAAMAMDTAQSATTVVLNNPTISAGAVSALVVALTVEKLFGPNIGDNEGAIYRSWFDRRIKVLATDRDGRTFGWHRRILLQEDRSKANLMLNDGSEDATFAPPNLTDGRGRLRLSSFEFTLADITATTADGADLTVRGSVRFHLARTHLESFVNFTIDAFSRSFTERVRASMKSEIGSHDRDEVIREQNTVEGHLLDKLRTEIEGEPGSDKEAGLGVIVESVSLSVVTIAGHSETRASPFSSGHNASLGALNSRDGLQWAVQMMRSVETQEERDQVIQLWAQAMEAEKTTRCAEAIAGSGNLIVMSPDELGLTRGTVNMEALRPMISRLSEDRPDLAAPLIEQIDGPAIETEAETVMAPLRVVKD